MKAFVTGGTGFVGSHLVEALRESGHDVTCLVRSEQKLRRMFPTDTPGFVVGSLSDESVLRSGMEQSDTVIHCAALTAARTEAEYDLTNRVATGRIARLASDSGIDRVVYVSSLAAAGPARRGRPIRDPEAANPVTLYGRSKLAGERELQKSGVPHVIIRPPTVYGPRDAELYRVFKLARVGVFPVFGNGSQELSLVHVHDLASAILRSATHGKPGTTYYACHREIVTSAELVRSIHHATGPGSRRARMIPIPRPVGKTLLAITGAAARLAGKATLLSADKTDEFYAPAWTCSPDALEADTGWKANYESEDGLAQTAEWYREQGWL